MNDDRFELVNAYLDGEASADERARVEGDAELLAEVDRWRAVVAGLSDTEPPSDAARESAIAAALAEFAAAPPAGPDTERASGPASTESTDVTTPGSIVPFDRSRRIRLMRAVSAAAAAAVIVVAGVAISQRGEDDDASPTAGDAQPARTAAEPFGAAIEPATTAATDIAATSVPPALELEADGAPDSESADAPFPDPAAAVPVGAADQASARTRVITDADELATLAAQLEADRPSEAVAIADCEDRLLEPDAVYRDEDGVEHPIVVVIPDGPDSGPDTGAIGADTGAIGTAAPQLAALDLDDCTIVLRDDATGR